MTLNKSIFAAALAAVALAISGCNGSSSGGGDAAATTTTTTGGKTAGKKSYTITMIAKSTTNPVFLSAKTGAEAAAAELSKSGPEIKIDWRTPTDEDAKQQATNIGQAVSGGSDAILLSCSDAPTLKGAIDDAVSKGVPVMTFDSDAPDSKRFAFYGADDEAVGTQTADEVAKLLNNKGNVAILAGNQNAPNLQRRSKAADAELRKLGLTVVGTFYHKETPEDAAQEVIATMKANPQINGWAMIGGWPLFTTSLLDLDPNKVKIVAVDALPAELPYVDKGIAPVLLAQPTYDWGYKSVHFIYDKIVSGKDVPVINKMDLVKVSKENLGTWAQQLKTWGFPGVDPKYLAMAPAAPAKK